MLIRHHEICILRETWGPGIHIFINRSDIYEGQWRIGGSCVFCAPLDRYIGPHIDRHIGRVSVDISTGARSTCRSIYGRLSADISVDIVADTLTVEYRSTVLYNISQKFRLTLSHVYLLQKKRQKIKGFWMMHLISVSDTHLFSLPSNLSFNFLCYKTKGSVRIKCL